MTMKTVLSAALVVSLAGCSGDSGSQSDRFSTEPALELLEALSADALQGRKTGTEENARARAMIIERLESLGISPMDGSFEHPFNYGAFADPSSGENATPTKRGVNIIGKIEGASDRGLSMIVTAHYDHVGVIDGEIYNGADDNASGVVGLLATAEYFTKNPPLNDVIILALDAEEDGLGGAIAFVANPSEPLDQVGLNINFDMLSRGDNGVLWASGTQHWPKMKPIMTEIAAQAPVEIKMGFDQGDGREDWTLLSDHAAFFRAGIPHLYFGVEDHPDYHRPTDDFGAIDQDWFLRSVESVVMVAAAMDAQLSEIYAMRATVSPSN